MVLIRPRRNLPQNGRSAKQHPLIAISDFEVPQTGGWNIEGWRAAAMKHGPGVLQLIEYAAQFKEMPSDKTLEATKGLNLGSNRQLAARLERTNEILGLALTELNLKLEKTRGRDSGPVH